MKVTYDPEVDVLSFEFSQETVARAMRTSLGLFWTTTRQEIWLAWKSSTHPNGCPPHRRSNTRWPSRRLTRGRRTGLLAKNPVTRTTSCHD